MEHEIVSHRRKSIESFSRSRSDSLTVSVIGLPLGKSMKLYQDTNKVASYNYLSFATGVIHTVFEDFRHNVFSPDM